MQKKKNRLLSATLLFTVVVSPITYSYANGIGVISSKSSQIVLKGVDETAKRVDDELEDRGKIAPDSSFAMPTDDSIAQKINTIKHNAIKHSDSRQPIPDDPILPSQSNQPNTSSYGSANLDNHPIVEPVLVDPVPTIVEPAVSDDEQGVPSTVNNEVLESQSEYQDPVIPSNSTNVGLVTNKKDKNSVGALAQDAENAGREEVNEDKNNTDLVATKKANIDELGNDSEDFDIDEDDDINDLAEDALAESDESDQIAADSDSESDSEPDKETPTGFCSPEALELGITHYRYEDADPKDLVAVGSRRLHRDAAESLKEMKAAAKKDGVKLVVGSAFRSIKYQTSIIKRKQKRKLSAKKIYTVSAPAGYSEHSTGYAVDFAPIDGSFAKSKAYSWLQKNAEQFNWEQSFTPEVSERNGVIVEPWHWRYVGTPEAKQLFEPKPCYE